MFKNINYTRIDLNSNYNNPVHQCKIIDSEFEDCVMAPNLMVAVVLCYEKRGFNVSQIAKQLYLFISDLHPDHLKWYKVDSPDIWDKYGKEIQKFLLFS